MGRRACAIALLLLLGAAGGCGVQRGYAPDTVPVYTGRTAAPAPASADSALVVSWNIRFAERLDQALAELRGSPRLADADIILLQEMDRAGTAALADSLGMHYVYAPAYVHPHHARLFGNAVLSRWPIIGGEAAVLPHGTPVTGHRRIAVAADLDLGRDRRLRVVSVHTATMLVGQPERLAQATVALAGLGGAGPAIVAGDFNTVSDWEITLLRRAARRAGFGAVRLPPGPTIVPGPRRLPGNTPVLDHVFLQGIEAGSRGVVRATAASDHYPVWVRVALPGGP